MKTQSSFIWSNCTVKLYTVSCINLNLTFIIYPRYAEFDLSFRLNKSFKKSVSSVFFFMSFYNCTKRFQNLFYCLMKFWFIWVFLYYKFNYFINIRHTTQYLLNVLLQKCDFAHFFAKKRGTNKCLSLRNTFVL